MIKVNEGDKSYLNQSGILWKSNFIPGATIGSIKNLPQLATSLLLSGKIIMAHSSWQNCFNLDTLVGISMCVACEIEVQNFP